MHKTKMNPYDPLTQHFRINLAQQRALKRLRVTTLADLLYLFPLRYTDISKTTALMNAESGDRITLFGTLSKLKTKKSFKTKIPMAEGSFTDISGETLKIVWFNQPYLAKMLKENSPIQLTGTLEIKNGSLSMVGPEVEPLSTLPIDTTDSLFGGTEKGVFGFPVYRQSKGITSKWIYHTIKKILGERVHEIIEDPIPQDIRETYNLPSLQTALVWIHAPKKDRDAESAQKRFAFEEVFLIQVTKQRDKHLYQELSGPPLSIKKDSIEAFTQQFPFTLTDSQQEAINTIISDLERSASMTRLLEGDVGSGKTAVASVATFATLTSSTPTQPVQVAYMAPTEILATQLFENFITHFTGKNVQIGLITGSGCRKFPSKVGKTPWTTISRPQLLKWVHNGEIPILVGTHALISEKVKFRNLRLVIIDEQHRFGTQQRMKLAQKQGSAPHYLSMTATPIPRTLALTIYGDLDLSVLDQMPKGRKSPITSITPPHKRDAVYEDIRKVVQQGRQCYVICPRINEPDPQDEQALQTTSVLAETKRLKKEVFPEFRIAPMHSKMKKKEREDIMDAFYKHEIDILVSTSVVEVGVNVPNATSIIIEGAERFGLAQLHQLRGRVLRSEHQAYCYLFTDTKSDKSVDRLKAFLSANNGFELAELDLHARGSGDLLGIKQWGISDIAMQALKNLKMVEAARTSAHNIIEQDPTLKKHDILRAHLERRETLHEE